MKKKTRNTLMDEPIGRLTTISDFLPPPEQLLASSKSMKITITLDMDTIAFFKEAAEKNEAKYQSMMREVLQGYARKFRRTG